MDRESKESYLRPLFLEDPRPLERPFAPADFLDELPPRFEARELVPPRLLVFFFALPEARLLPRAGEDFRPPEDFREEDFFIPPLDFFALLADFRDDVLFLADDPLLALRDAPPDVDRDAPPLFTELLRLVELENFVPPDAAEDFVAADRAELPASLPLVERALDAPSDDWFADDPVAS